MIYIFDNKQKIIKVLTNEDLTAGHLDFKINTATTFEFSVPANKSLSSSAKFVAVPHPLDDSKFVMLRLTERTDNADTIDYSAYELAYQELATDGYIADKRPANQDALTLMKTALNGSNWELNNVNVAGTASTNFYYIDHLTAISKVVELLGGEIVFYVEIQGNTISGRYMDYLARQGEDTSKVFANGSNLLTIERQSDTSGIYTAILPRGKGIEIDGDNNESTPDGYGRRLNIADAVWKKSDGKPLNKPSGEIILYDPTVNAEWGQIDGNYRLLLETYDDVDDVNMLINSAYKTLQSVNHPKIQYSATVADVGGLSLGDTVLIMHSDRKLSYKTRVFKVNYDLLDPEQTEISLGDDLSSNSITSQMNSVSSLQSVASEQTQWTINRVGRNPVTFGTVAPDNPKVGDTFFKYLPNGDTVVYEWNGEIWVEKVSSNTGEQIDLAVDSAIETAKSQAAEMDEVRASEAAVFQSEANAASSSAAAERADMFKQSTSMATSAATHADSMANSAAAYGKAQAASALSSANYALTTAKAELTTAIGQETADRNQAVSAVNSQAQGYADQAKADAIEAANTADGQVRKDFKVTTDALSSTITQNKQDSDGKISTAQSTATQALDGLSTKVSQTDYDKKTGDLSTKVNTVTQTATETKDELANVSKTVDSQSAKINTISNTVDGTTQTVSDIQTEQGKQSGSINKLETRADGFDASITKINDFVNSQGQVNQLFNTEFTPDLEGWNSSDSHISYVGINNSAVVKGSNVLNIMHDSTTSWSRYSQRINTFVPEGVLSASVQARAASGNWMFAIDSYNSAGTRTIIKQVTVTSANTLLKIENVTIPSDTVDLYYSFWSNTEGTIAIAQPMLVFSSTVGDYVQGNYSNNGALAKVKLTADKAALDLSTYKTNADGRISKAQSDITATANEVKTKVSQSDYNTKTNDLTTKYGQVKATADAVTTDVANYKKSNDSKVSANTANITANAKAIDLKVSQTDFDSNSKDVNTKIANQKITVDKISDSVTELQAKANAQGQINQLMNTEFTPDLQGWDSSETSSGVKTPYRQYIYQGSNMLTFDARNQADKKYSSIKQTIPFATSGSNRVVSVSWWSRIAQGSDLYGSTHIRSYDANLAKLTDVAKNWDSSSSMTLQKFENVAIPDEARFVEVTFAVREGYLAFLTKPILIFDKTVGTYVPGNYNNNSRVTALELDINGIHGLVDDPKKGLSATWNLANDGQSIAVQAKTAASTADGKAVAAQKDATTAITTANGTQTTVDHIQGDISDIQSTQTQTANQVTTEIQDRKNGDSSVRTDLSSLIDQRVKETKSGYESYFSQQAQGIIAGVSTPNQLINTEFTPDLQGWSGNSFISYVAVNKSTKKMGSNVLNITHSADTGWGQYSQKISNFMVGGSVSASVYAREDSGDWAFTLDSYDATGKRTILRSVSVSTGYSLLKIENVEIPQDAVELRYSFWSQTVGMLLIAQPMLVFSDSVPIYMPGSYSGINTSTVLELFKDNWALGIADNAGRIISGINGDTSGTVIQGKKLVINSDTTINGKAFIDGSVIKNASIGTAQIGKAAIGSAQIIDVDVSKISGNIANFITANVNTLNARVLYGDTGHLGTTDTGLIINKQDDHLQLSSKGQYDVDTKRAQLELLNYADNIDANMQGSLNYYKNPHNNGTGLGIRLLGNQILAIDEAVATGNLYLSPYASGQVQVVNRDRNGFQDIKASKFVTSSERKYKSEINEFNDDALELVNGLNIRRYIKNSEDEIGVIADEADKRILDKTNTGVDLYSFVSVVAKAVQELSAQVKELQSERPNN